MYRTLLAIICLHLSACASQGTAYQPMAWDGGYFHEKLSEDEYIVGFHGNSFTAYQIVSDYALLRAAEIGDKLGYQYFSIDAQTDKSRSIEYQGTSTSTTTGTAYPIGGTINYSGTTITTPSSYTEFKPRVHLRVKYFTNKPEGRFLELRNVAKEMAELKAKYSK